VPAASPAFFQTGTVALADLFQRLRADGGGASEAPAVEVRHPTKALARFLSALGECAQPVLVDLGPVVGGNVTFFGERLGCKIVVEDLFTDLDRHARDGRAADLATFLETRFTHDDDSIDGILCWDVFDYLDPDAATALAARLTRMLRPRGVLLAFFATAEPGVGAARYTKHVVIDHETLEHRPYGEACTKRRPVLSGEVERMFGPLRVAEQFLLKTRVREVLFRKPAGTVAAGSSLQAAAN
jgi:predicted SAM-dependent methyltransferase